MAGWKTLALNRLELLEDEVEGLDQPTAVKQVLRADLEGIRQQHRLGYDGAHDGTVASLLGDDEVNHTWDELHRAEVRLEEHKPLAVAVEDARRHAAAELSTERRKQLEDDLRAGGSKERTRAVALAAVREAHAASAMKHEGERQQHRGVFGLSLFLVLAAAVTVLLQWRAFPDNPLVPRPADAATVSAWATLLTVMAFGAFGGAFSALISLYVAPFATGTYWFDPRPTLAFMKISVGVWTAVLGSVALQEGLLTGTYATFTSLMFLAFVFGYAQQAVTSMLDKRVEGLGSA